MGLRALAVSSYYGEEGLAHLRDLQQEMRLALQARDWDAVRRLDRACVKLVDLVIDANPDDKQRIVQALCELKGIYAGLILACEQQVAALTH